MSKPIVQSVDFPATAKQLYDIYLDPQRHAAFTGGRVRISPKPGSQFTAFDRMLIGKTLLTIPGKLIVQRWRAHHWKKNDLDSILILTFTPIGKRGRIDLVHVNVPDHDHAGVTDGWKKYYWTPLSAYLRGAQRRRFSPKAM
ncbi:MAG: SRPBCC domain-containing protein [Tepidisphaeraceae bacterium]|jgi:activator of HSP90 ATPase